MPCNPAFPSATMDGDTECPPLRIAKNSLYLAARLNSIVRQFSQRLQERVKQKKKCVNPFGASSQRALRLRALSDLDKSKLPHRRSTLSDFPEASIEHEDHGRFINNLLQDLDEHTISRALPLTVIAADDALLINGSEETSIETVVSNLRWHQAAYLFDASTFLIDKLEVLYSAGEDYWQIQKGHDAHCQRLKDEKFIANMLHLLRRLQHFLFQILVHKIKEKVDELARHWHEYVEQQKKLDEGCFTEWPSGRRPLSTTWPWNIRPSLVILWGVCWMFFAAQYNNQDESDMQLPFDLGSLDGLEGLEEWLPNMIQADQEYCGYPFQFIAPLPRALGTAVPRNPSQSHTQSRDANVLSVAQPFGYANFSVAPSNTSAPRFGAPRPPMPNQTGHGIQTTQFDASNTRSLNDPLYYESPFSILGGGRPRDLIFYGGGDFRHSPVRPRLDQSIGWWQTSESRSAYDPEAPPPYQGSNVVPTIELLPSTDSTHPLNYQSAADLGRMPGHHSSSSVDGLSHPLTPTSDRQLSVPAPVMATKGSPESETSTTKAQRAAVKRDTEPPRNVSGQIYCSHPECVEKNETFCRPCEWNKHMDKHDRPYKCMDPQCDKIQGFTYSGGLLRHQREVHKKNVSSTKQPLFCPFPNCNRSSGTGFTRLENLNEHKRRRHTGQSTDGHISSAVSPVEYSPINQRPASATSQTSMGDQFLSTSGYSDHKRKRSDDSDDFDPQEVHRLRLRLAEKEKQITELKVKITRLENQLQQRPQPPPPHLSNLH